SAGDMSRISGLTHGRAPGGILLDTAGQQSVSAANVKYIAADNSFASATWKYRLPVSPREAYDIFQSINHSDTIALDITTTGGSSSFSLARDSKVARRMIVADAFLGDIAKGFGYFKPLYNYADGYEPVPYTPSHSGPRFAVFFAFKPNAFTVANGVLSSNGRTVS